MPTGNVRASRRGTERRVLADAKETRLRMLGAVIRSARAEMTQEQLGEAIGLINGGEAIPQTTISRWEKGLVELSCEQVRDLELALGLRFGTLLSAAGYVSPDYSSRDVESILRSDPSVDPDFRADLVRTYKGYVGATRKIKDAARQRR